MRQVRVGNSNAELHVFGTVAILRELVAYMAILVG